MNRFFDPKSLMGLVGGQKGEKPAPSSSAPLKDLIPGQLAKRLMTNVNDKLKTVPGVKKK